MSATGPLDDDPAGLATWVAGLHPDTPGWLDRFAHELDRLRGSTELRRILEAWSLSRADGARLFGVSRQAVAKWMAVGAPAERAAAIADLAAATDLLIHYLRRDRIAAVVRRPSRALGDRSLIELAAIDTAVALQAVREMFNFSRLHA